MLEFDGVRVDERGVDITAAFEGVTAVVGPNGAGKSTILSLVAGGLRPSSGRVRLDGALLAGPGTFVPAHRRRAAYLEQRALLFPHLSVLANAAFGSTIARALAELAAVGADDLAARKPSGLSGGQAQRVALARALAIDPQVVLLDEPLAALDATVVPELRRVLRARLAGRTALLVTHDLLDVLTLADHVCVLGGGRVVEHGRVAELGTRPTSAFLADLVGTNLLAGTATPAGILVGDVEVAGIPVDDLAPGEAALASVPPNAVALYRSAPDGSPRNVLPATVTSIEPMGPVIRVALSAAGRTLSADLTPAAVAGLGIIPGDDLHAVIKATQVTIYPASNSAGRAKWPVGTGPLPLVE